MSISTVETGKRAEARAADYLRLQGYKIVCHNYRWRGGEIDLIARQGDCLVFVEVKARRGRGYGLPEEAVTPRKQHKLVRTARRYLSEHPTGLALRFDVVALSGGRARPHKNAFLASE